MPILVWFYDKLRAWCNPNSIAVKPCPCWWGRPKRDLDVHEFYYQRFLDYEEVLDDYAAVEEETEEEEREQEQEEQGARSRQQSDVQSIRSGNLIGEAAASANTLVCDPQSLTAMSQTSETAGAMRKRDWLRMKLTGGQTSPRQPSSMVSAESTGSGRERKRDWLKKKLTGTAT
eukprot:TRINITY_DN18297_c0_g2_i1.p1 TRINITY_DN18297_c0_g2~~TRINITY_DN18297_c0_g2_i1.p1  ORF type:complete len:190 (-),score=32.04 TRINITY_DN18297_c0_g2_i1:156-677(-)